MSCGKNKATSKRRKHLPKIGQDNISDTIFQLRPKLRQIRPEKALHI